MTKFLPKLKDAKTPPLTVPNPGPHLTSDEVGGGRGVTTSLKNFDPSGFGW